LDHRRVRRQKELRSHCPASAGIFSLQKRRTAPRLKCGVFFLCCFTAAACARTQPTSIAIKDGLIIGTPEGTVAGTEQGVVQIARTLSLEGLTQLSPDGRALPRLAEKWGWENDFLRLRVILQKGVTFHDGTPLDSKLAVEVLRQAIARPANRALYPSLNYVRSVQEGGELQVVIDLSEPSAFLPEDLEIPLEIGTKNVGTGAFRIVQSAAPEIVLQRFDHYRGGSPSIQRVVIRPFETLRTAWTSLLRGDVDMVTDVPPEAVEFIRNDDVQVISFERRYQYLVAFNSHRAPFLSPTVRRALNAAVDRDRLVKNVLQEHGIPATGPLWPKYWAYDSSLPAYNLDQALVTSLLDNAGFRLPKASNQSDGPPARLRFNCILPAGFSILERLALELQKQLYNVGVDMEFQSLPVNEYNARVQSGQFDAAMLDSISGPTPGRAYIFWRSGRRFKGLNVFGYENPEAERLFEVLRTSGANDTAVRSATRGLQRVFLEDPPALFLAWNQRARAVRRDFQVPADAGRDPILTLWRWTPNTSTQLSSVP